MGKTRKSIRTLASGERVEHHPPSELHPDGNLVLIREGSPLADRIVSRRADQLRRHDELHRRVRRETDIARARMVAGGVPAEKRCI